MADCPIFGLYIPYIELTLFSTVADILTEMAIKYILYASGTNGRPKGIIQENHSVVNYCEAFEDEMHICSGNMMQQYSVCSFDVFVEEVFTTLLNGAPLAVPTEAVRNGPIKGLMDL